MTTTPPPARRRSRERFGSESVTQSPWGTGETGCCERHGPVALPDAFVAEHTHSCHAEAAPSGGDLGRRAAAAAAATYARARSASERWVVQLGRAPSSRVYPRALACPTCRCASFVRRTGAARARRRAWWRSRLVDGERRAGCALHVAAGRACRGAASRRRRPPVSRDTALARFRLRAARAVTATPHPAAVRASAPTRSRQASPSRVLKTWAAKFLRRCVPRAARLGGLVCRSWRTRAMMTEARGPRAPLVAATQRRPWAELLDRTAYAKPESLAEARLLPLRAARARRAR